MKQWRAAAKAGECEGQLRYGLALYKGEAGCMQVGVWRGQDAGSASAMVAP